MVMSDVVEEILLRLPVKNLLPCKSVCKSWYSLISSPFFKNTYAKFLCNKEEVNTRRVAMIPRHWSQKRWCSYDSWVMVGSCNGLVCICTECDNRIIVSNPLTREFRELQYPLNCFEDTRSLGFGYDSSTDDYKVVMAIPQGWDRTLVLIFSMKSNMWKIFGHVDYWFDDGALKTQGILYNGALHWFWFDANYHTEKRKALIVSFDLAKEEFTEIPQPDDSRYGWSFDYSLGIMEGRLCIFPSRDKYEEGEGEGEGEGEDEGEDEDEDEDEDEYEYEYEDYDEDDDFPTCGTWAMKSYNSWGQFPTDCEMKDHAIHYILKDTVQSTNTPPYFCDENIQLSRSKEYIPSPMFVQTLVSPYVNNNGGPNQANCKKSTTNAEIVQEKREIEKVYSVEDNEEKNKSSHLIEAVKSDAVREILIRLPVKDLLRCKSVCKSWYSLISDTSFVKSHCKFWCNKEEYIRRKIDRITYYHNWSLEGSSNGLVCIHPYGRICVINPLTRVFREIHKPPKRIPKENQCFGFGYDSSSDDYKVFLAISQQGKALVQILSFKSNVWKPLGHVSYIFNDSSLSVPGILFNGALHWFWFNPNDTTRKNILLVSFDLAKEEFREIPQPDDPRYVWNYGYRVGIIEGRLCIFPTIDSDAYPSCGIWVMKSDNSWELFPDVCEMKDYAIHYMLKDTIMRTYFCEHNIQLSRGKEHIRSPMFVQTLVSPYANNNGGPSHAKNDKSAAYAGSLQEKGEIEELYSKENKEEEKEIVIGLLEVEGGLKEEHKSRN